METLGCLHMFHRFLPLFGIFGNRLVESTFIDHWYLYAEPFCRLRSGSRCQLDRICCRGLHISVVEGQFTDSLLRGCNVYCRRATAKVCHNNGQFEFQSYHSISEGARSQTGGARCVCLHAPSVICWLVLVVDRHSDCSLQSDLYCFLCDCQLEILPWPDFHGGNDTAQLLPSGVCRLPTASRYRGAIHQRFHRLWGEELNWSVLYIDRVAYSEYVFEHTIKKWITFSNQ